MSQANTAPGAQCMPWVLQHLVLVPATAHLETSDADASVAASVCNSPVAVFTVCNR